LRLDRRDSLPIPGCAEKSIRDRLDEADLKHDRSRHLPLPKAPFKTVYVFEEEALLEVSNRTIHALLHLSWIDVGAARTTVVMSIYTKSRGRFSDAYLVLIRPFRYAVVYPAWLEHLARTWRVHQEDQCGLPCEREASSS